MSLIAMAVYDTNENERTKYTARTLEGLLSSVDWRKHRLFVADNNSCSDTVRLLLEFSKLMPLTVVRHETNVGTAEAINSAWRHRRENEHCVKIDNDIIINKCDSWVEQMEEVVRLGMPQGKPVGQVGLKRKDCIESTTNTNPFYKSVLTQLTHEPGHRWIVVESQFHIMGSCCMHSSALLDKIGYMMQHGVYGFDDSFMSARARKAGFETVMLPHIDIDHIDTGANPYQQEKERLANDVFTTGKYRRTLEDINNGNIYYNPFRVEG